jgi:hypothetical protein
LQIPPFSRTCETFSTNLPKSKPIRIKYTVRNKKSNCVKTPAVCPVPPPC